MTNEYKDKLEDLRIANMAFSNGVYDTAYNMLEKLTHYIISKEAKAAGNKAAYQQLRHGIKNALAAFSTCKDEALWEMSCELYHLLRSPEEQQS